MTKTEVKNNVHNDVTIKTQINSISPIHVGKNMEDIIDLIPDPTTPLPGPQGLSAYQVWLAAGNIGSQQDYLNSLIGPQGADGASTQILSYLPIPQITKRKIKLGLKPSDKIREKLDAISTRNTTVPNLVNIVFPEEYYLEQFDISFNSFSTNELNNWLSLPDKRLELCLVSNRSYKNISRNSTIHVSGQGNKDDYTNTIVHPTNYRHDFISGTIFSDSTGSDAGILNQNISTLLPYQNRLSQTEWKLDETSDNFGENVFSGGLNRFNNPNLTIQIDVREFLCNRKSNTDLLKYPKVLDGTDGYIRVRNIGDIKKNTTNNKVYKRNSVLFFRLSAGLPSSAIDTGDKVIKYTKRIYSDLSLPIYIVPKIQEFIVDPSAQNLIIKPYIYGHTTKIGSK